MKILNKDIKDQEIALFILVLVLAICFFMLWRFS